MSTDHLSMQIKNGAPPPPQTMAHKPRIVMPKSHKYKEKLSIHLPHGHVGIIANGYSRPLPYGLLWWRVVTFLHRSTHFPARHLWRGGGRQAGGEVPFTPSDGAGLLAANSNEVYFVGINTKRGYFFVLGWMQIQGSKLKCAWGRTNVCSHHMSSAADAVGAPANRKNKKKPAIIYSPT